MVAALIQLAFQHCTVITLVNYDGIIERAPDNVLNYDNLVERILIPLTFRMWLQGMRVRSDLARVN